MIFRCEIDLAFYEKKDGAANKQKKSCTAKSDTRFGRGDAIRKERSDGIALFANEK